MTEQEMREAQERADRIVAKVRSLVALENKVLEARETVHQLSVTRDTETAVDLAENNLVEHQNMLSGLESQLNERVEELDEITEELKWATPCFRAYVLPQMSEIVGTLKACDAIERNELSQLVSTLTEEEGTQSSEELEAAIIARLKDNLERTFGPE